jgi:hypothetical protein
MIWNREPVLFLSTIQTAVALFVAFGLDFTAEQVGAITAVAAAVLGLIARGKVTPVE